MNGLSARRVVWQILQSVSSGAYAEIAIERALRNSNLKGSDRSLVMEISYGAIRQRYMLDCWIDLLDGEPVEGCYHDVTLTRGESLHCVQCDEIIESSELLDDYLLKNAPFTPI